MHICNPSFGEHEFKKICLVYINEFQVYINVSKQTEARWCTPVYSAFQKQRQRIEFKAVLGYIVHLRPV